MRIACLAQMVGILAVLHNLWLRRAADDPAALARDALGHYRALLIGQRDNLATVGRWYIAPTLPGMLLFFAATARATALKAGCGPALIVGARWRRLWSAGCSTRS